MEVYTSTKPTLSCHILTFIFTTILLAISHHAPPVSAASTKYPPLTTYKIFIKTSCSTTSYPTLCFQTLSRHAYAIKTNRWRLSIDAITISIISGRAASATVSDLLKPGRLANRDAEAIKDCIGNIRGSIGWLMQSRAGLRTFDESENKLFAMSSIKTWASAAITDESTCTDEFSGGKVSEGVKRKVRAKILPFVQLTINALCLINGLPV